MAVKSLLEARNKKKQDKEQRIAKAIVDDFNTCEKILTLTLKSLDYYKKYVQVMEIISCVQTNRTLIEIQLKKYEKLANAQKN